MKRLRLATWAAAAGLGLVAGCQSSSTSCCQSGCQSEGLLSRLGLRPRTSGTVMYDGPATGMPVEGMPITGMPGPGGGDCPCAATSGGPLLGSPPPFMPIPGPSAPMTTIPGPSAPMTTLPSPLPGGPPPLATVPNGTGQAVPVPAGPSSRRS